jgi:hypothetical protein
MKPQSSTLPVILGSVLVIGSLFCLAGVSMTAFHGDKDKDPKKGQVPNPDTASGLIEENTEQLIVPIQPRQASGADATSNHENGIRIGTYSNPPTSISSSSYSSGLHHNRPLGITNSSHNNNSDLSSQNLNTSNPSTSRFSSSNPSRSSSNSLLTSPFPSTGSSNNSLLNSPSLDTGTNLSTSTRSSFNSRSSTRNRSSNNDLGL